MSGITNATEQRVMELFNYMVGTINGKDGRKLVSDNNIITNNYTFADIITLFDRLYSKGYTTEQIKNPSNKLFHLIYLQLDSFSPAIGKESGFAYYMVEDNLKLKDLLNDGKSCILKINKTGINTESGNNLFLKEISAAEKIFARISDVAKHYEIKENILFPQIEKNWKEFQCLKLMWSIHDDIRRMSAEILQLLNSLSVKPELSAVKKFNEIVGTYYFSVNTIIFREEKVLLPAMLESFSSSLLTDMLRESLEIGFPFLDNDRIKKEISKVSDSGEITGTGGKINNREKNFSNIVELAAGSPTVEQLQMVLDLLPLDLTFIDKNDKVVFFTNPPERVFTRTKSIIGRKVQNCHPPESMHIVQKILDAFRNGSRNEASFVIKKNGRTILIKYIAVRDKHSGYEGTLEITQDITDLKKTDTEKRLLDWD